MNQHRRVELGKLQPNSLQDVGEEIIAGRSKPRVQVQNGGKCPVFARLLNHGCARRNALTLDEHPLRHEIGYFGLLDGQSPQIGR